MNVDHFYTIGDSHQECQDYASSKIFDNGLAFACVADGCSGSHDRCRSVDIGARLLALSAEFVIKNMTKDMEDPMNFLYHEFFVLKRQNRLGKAILSKAIDIAKPLLYNDIICEESFDSTLVLVVSKDDQALIYCFGDGVISIEHKAYTEVYDINYTSGAPYYLSYQLDNIRHAVYKNVKNNSLVVKSDWKTENAFSTHTVEDELNWENAAPFDTSSFYIPESIGFKSISVMSDGVSSFEEEKTPMDVIEMTREATAFKNYNGIFVQRRMKKFLRTTERRGLSHYDDFSIATIYNDG